MYIHIHMDSSIDTNQNATCVCFRFLYLRPENVLVIRLPEAGAAVRKQKRKQKELLAKIAEVNQDATRSRAAFEQRMQSIAKARPR